MTGRKTLGEVRAELEAALGKGPAGSGQVAQSLRRFLGGEAGAPAVNPQPSGESDPPTPSKKAEQGTAPDRGRNAGPGE